MTTNHFLRLAACAALFPGCHDVSGPPESPNQLRTCLVEYSSNWPGGIFSASTNMPNGCPVTLAFAGQTVNFNAQVSWPSNGYVQYGYVTLLAFNRNFQSIYRTYYPQWSQPGGGVTVQGPGQYEAGTGDGSPQQDYLNFQFVRTSNGANTTVGFYIPFQFVGFPIRITGPTSVQPYTDFPVNADVLSPSLIPPVTYSWTRNGSPLYYTGDYFSYPGSDMGVDHEFGLTVTDSEGQTLTATHYVHTLNCVGEGCIEQ